MPRTTASARTAASARDIIHPQTVNLTVYGDSFSDSAGGFGWIGETVGTQTSEHFRYREQATGGDTVAEIRTAFEADFPAAQGNAVSIQGAINSIRVDVSLESIKTDYAAMADAVIANGQYKLHIVNMSPWFGSINWNQERQDVTDKFNLWLHETYGNYVANSYAGLSDPALPIQLRDEFYKAARTDIHPSRNGDVVIDDLIGETTFFRNPTISRDADAGNTHPFPNTPGSWSNNLRATVGGNPILMCDGTYSSVNGIIPSTDSISHIARQTIAAFADSTDVVAKTLVKPGQHQWVRLEWKDNGATLNSAYFDLLNQTIGTTVGTPVPAITKAARGWMEISLTGDSGVGAGTNWITIFPAEANGDANFVGDARTPSIYVDRTQLVLA